MEESNVTKESGDAGDNWVKEASKSLYDGVLRGLRILLEVGTVGGGRFAVDKGFFRSVLGGALRGVFEEDRIFGRGSGFDGGWVFVRVENPNGGRVTSVTDLRDAIWEPDVDRRESDVFRGFVSDTGRFAGDLTAQVGREEATDGTVKDFFVVESERIWIAGTDDDLRWVLIELRLVTIGGTGSGGMFSSTPFDLGIEKSVCVGVDGKDMAGTVADGSWLLRHV